MLLAIVLCLFLTLIIAAVIFGFDRFITISDSNAKKLELFGYVMLFSSIVWAYIIKDYMFQEFYEYDTYVLNQKLQDLFLLVKQASEGINSNAEEMYLHFMGCEPSKSLQQQLKMVTILEAVLQVLSVVFISVGRLQELKKMSLEDGPRIKLEKKRQSTESKKSIKS